MPRHAPPPTEKARTLFRLPLKGGVIHVAMPCLKPSAGDEPLVTPQKGE